MPLKIDPLGSEICGIQQRAYTAFEKLIDPSAPDDSEALAPTRSELSALLRLLNEALVARIDAINAAAGDVRQALQGSLHSAT